ncbi:hypothetical protein B296_00004886, partial [Ensete ventricosum]
EHLCVLNIRTWARCQFRGEPSSLSKIRRFVLKQEHASYTETKNRSAGAEEDHLCAIVVTGWSAQFVFVHDESGVLLDFAVVKGQIAFVPHGDLCSVVADDVDRRASLAGVEHPGSVSGLALHPQAGAGGPKGGEEVGPLPTVEETDPKQTSVEPFRERSNPRFDDDDNLRAQRERLRDLSVFERLNGNPARTSPHLAVKKFCRTISTVAIQESDIRPPPVLQRTLKYLMNLVNSEEHPFEFVHDFVFDRTRSIRQDLSMQNITDDQAISMYEEMVQVHCNIHVLIVAGLIFEI